MPASILQRFARLLLRIFFRELEVVGRERVPAGVPLVVVANHGNGLIDPFLVFACLPRKARFLAKSTLFRLPLLGPLLRWAGSIPVYRRIDAGEDTERNEETFIASYEVLAEGGVIALFPEGISHSEPYLMPLKTGAARIALGAEERQGPLALQILPVGLVFDAKEQFRSRALVTMGEPIPVPAGGPAESDQVRTLTERIADGIETVTLNYSSWSEARLLERAADIYGDDGASVDDSLAQSFAMRHRFATGYDDIKRAQPERLTRVAAAVADYDRRLAELGLRDGELSLTEVPFVRAVRYFLGALAHLLLFLPFAMMGLLLNWLPYRLVDLLARRLQESTDVAATYKLLGALVVYPACWILQAGLAFFVPGRDGMLLAFALLVLAPISGWVALRFREHGREVWSRTRAYLLLRSRARLTAELRELREQICADTAALDRLYRDLDAVPEP